MQSGGPGGSGGPRPSRPSQAPRTSRASQTSGGPARQSGVPLPGAQPPPDSAAYGLPDLTGYTPRMTPRVAPDQPLPQPPAGSSQPGQPHTLGITSKLARIRATGSPSLPPPAATITQQMRAMTAPDVARQTLDEQKMLAHELLILPDELETSGLAKTHERSDVEAVNAYADLANATWVALAEERLEQAGAEEAYRQSAIAIARRVRRMHNESQLAANNTQFPLPRKRPFFWRRRVRMQREGLRDWQSALASPSDIRALGASLARLRGATALASASNFELMLWSMFPAAVGDMVMILWLGFIVALIAVLAQGMLTAVGALALAATATLALRILLALLVRRGPARLDYLYAVSVFSTLRSPRASTPGARAIAVLLRAWGALTITAGLLGMVAGLGYSVWQIVQRGVTIPTQALDWVALVGDLIVRATILPALIGLAAVALLALPLLLLSAVRFIGELGGNIGWKPAGRRYALAPALHVLAFLAAGTMAGLVALAPQLGLRNLPLTRLSLGPLTLPITLQTVALFVVLLLLLLVGLDIPFRIGVARWRRHWLRELTGRRAEIDAHVRRLSAIDPQTGAQDASEENLRAMQYDLVLLQFYTTRTDETRRVSGAPYGWVAGVGVVLLLAVVALLVDSLAQQLAHLLFNVG